MISGSFNFSKAAKERNFENMEINHCPATIANYIKRFEKDWADISRYIENPEEYKKKKREKKSQEKRQERQFKDVFGQKPNFSSQPMPQKVHSGDKRNIRPSNFHS